MKDPCKPLLSRHVLKTLTGSPKGKVSTSVGLGLGLVCYII